MKNFEFSVSEVIGMVFGVLFWLFLLLILIVNVTAEINKVGWTGVFVAFMFMPTYIFIAVTVAFIYMLIPTKKK